MCIEVYGTVSVPESERDDGREGEDEGDVEGGLGFREEVASDVPSRETGAIAGCCTSAEVERCYEYVGVSLSCCS